MTFNFDALLASGVNDLPCRYDTEHAIQYALGVGFARDGADRRELDYVYEGRGLRTVPAMAGALLNNDFLASSGWDASRVFVAEQKLELYRPLPPSAELVADRRVVAVLDHGRELGVSIMIESEVRMAKDGTVLFTLGNTLLAGADGGFGGPEGSGPLPHKLPDRDADLSCELPIYRNQPLIFRLCGDRGPLYVAIWRVRWVSGQRQYRNNAWLASPAARYCKRFVNSILPWWPDSTCASWRPSIPAMP